MTSKSSRQNEVVNRVFKFAVLRCCVLRFTKRSRAALFACAHVHTRAQCALWTRTLAPAAFRAEAARAQQVGQRVLLVLVQAVELQR